jgi:WD40 repeat protein
VTSMDVSVRLWDLNDGNNRCTRTLRDERIGMIYSIAFSPDGRTLASAGQNNGDGMGTLSFWVLSDDVFTSHRAIYCQYR